MNGAKVGLWLSLLATGFAVLTLRSLSEAGDTRVLAAISAVCSGISTLLSLESLVLHEDS